jgi:hypothetical protein
MYEKIGLERGLSAEERAQQDQIQQQEKYTTEKGRNTAGTPEAQARADFYKKAYKLDLDPSLLSASDMDKLAPGLASGNLEISTQDVVQNGQLIKKVVAVDKKTGKVVKTTDIGGGTPKGVTGKNIPVPLDVIKQVNADRTKIGLQSVPEDGSITYQALEAMGYSGMQARLAGVLQGTNDTNAPFDPTKLPKGQKSDLLNKLSKDATKIKTDKAESDGAVATIQQQYDLAVNQKNPVAANAVQRGIAMLYNKGALSDGDVKAFSGASDIKSRLDRYIQSNYTTGLPFSDADLVQFKNLIPTLGTKVGTAVSEREKDIRTQAAYIHPGAGDYLFSTQSQQPSTSGAESATMPAQGSSKKRFIVDGQPRELTREEFNAEKARGAKITR